MLTLDSHTISCIDSSVILFRSQGVYVLKSEDAPMYFYCAACARLWSEQNYYNFLDGNFWNGLLYERWHGYENSLANLIKIRKVLARCE